MEAGADAAPVLSRERRLRPGAVRDGGGRDGLLTGLRTGLAPQQGIIPFALLFPALFRLAAKLGDALFVLLAADAVARFGHLLLLFAEQAGFGLGNQQQQSQ